MLKQGIAPEDIAAGLEKWLARPDARVPLLPHLVSDVIRAKTAPAATRGQPIAHHDRKTLGWDEAAAAAKRSLGLIPGAAPNSLQPASLDRPLLEILCSDEPTPTENIA